MHEKKRTKLYIVKVLIIEQTYLKSMLQQAWSLFHVLVLDNKMFLQ